MDAHQQPKILVIRGGAIGDFLLTLPSIGLLREAFPDAHLEILGYKHIVAIAEGRHYADATRSIEYGGLATFFIPGSVLPPDLASYFSSFQQVISYLYDPDGFFETNLRRAGVKNLLCAYTPIGAAESVHAARQLARPLEQLALFLDQKAEPARLHPLPGDRAFANEFLGATLRPILAVHPGSGGKHKLWPLDHWRQLLETVRAESDSIAPNPEIVLVGGEADVQQIEALRAAVDHVAWNLPLPHLAAVLERCSAFVGHDSGISHLAAAAGARSVILFGPTDPAIWAPQGRQVKVLRAPSGDLSQISPRTVLDCVKSLLEENT
ncbi:MAG: glycosyltransferase family 9 protein [Verrucomicrobiota bacterium]